MVYTPPAGDNIGFSGPAAYVPPAGDAIYFTDGADPSTVVRAAVDQIYDLEAAVVRMAVDQVYNLTFDLRTVVDQVYNLTFDLRTAVDQVYGLRLGYACNQWYGDVPVIRKANNQFYGDCWPVKRAVVQPYGDMIVARRAVVQPYNLPFVVRTAADQPYSIAAAAIRRAIEQFYDLSEMNSVRWAVDQPYGLLGDPGQVLTYTTAVTVGKVVIDPTTITIAGSLNEYCLSCTLDLAIQADYLACAVGSDLEITINGETYLFFVEGRGRNREHGSTGYTVQGLGKTALLDAPYASPVAVELSGLASTIVRSLAPGYTVQWDTVDWYIPANTLLPADKTPLETIRDIAHAAGAIVQTAPDGTLVVQPDYIIAVPDWSKRTPDYFLTDALDFFTDSAVFEHRDGFNRFLISDQLTSEETVRLEEEAITDTTKYIRGYKTPWADTFTLRHTGGDWVTIEPLGTEVIDKTQVVEFVAGSGKTQYPIYAVTEMEWLQTSLGVVTYAEDGTLEAGSAEESLLSITYQTQCLRWKVTNAQSEQVQFIAEEVEI